MATLQSSTINGTLSVNTLGVTGGVGATGNVNTGGNINVSTSGNIGILRVNNFQCQLTRESPNRGPLPLSWASNRSGANLHSDEEFASGNNGINVYNNFGGSATTITRETGTNVPNTTGVWLRINTDASSAVTPGLGGWFFADFAKVNALHVCYFTALVPSGYTIGFHSNSMGTGNINYWATSNAGTGKWENYVYVVQAGNGGNSSTFFFALDGGPRPVVWYLARANSFRLG
jgi:hypothetical protein